MLKHSSCIVFCKQSRLDAHVNCRFGCFDRLATAGTYSWVDSFLAHLRVCLQPGSNYKEQLNSALKDLCNSRKLKVSGNKAELVRRLEDYDRDNAKVPTPALSTKAFV